jgi:Dual specificity phosphatase, catalytic domain
VIATCRWFRGIPIITSMTILRFSLYLLFAAVCTNAAALRATPSLLANACVPTIAQDSFVPPLPPTQQTETPQAPVDAPSDVITKQLIPDFAEVTPTLYRGAQPRKHGFETLAKMGVQIVVDLRGDRKGERKEVTSLGMQYVPMHWECSFPKDRTFADFLTLIRKNPGKKIFVHCRVGDDRTGMMIAAYRMADEGWSPRQAMKEMTEYGFNLPHRRLICPRLSEYEEHFPERFATKPEFEELRSTKPSQLPDTSPSRSEPAPTKEPPSQPPL